MQVARSTEEQHVLAIESGRVERHHEFVLQQLELAVSRHNQELATAQHLLKGAAVDSDAAGDGAADASMDATDVASVPKAPSMSDLYKRKLAAAMMSCLVRGIAKKHAYLLKAHRDAMAKVSAL